MSRPSPRTALRTSLRVALAGLVTGLLVATTRAASPAARASGTNPVTPGDFTGYGFDQCETQPQRTMNRWLKHSPFLAVGIYISGKSRACREQSNLTPTWVRKQLKKGWRLLPITLGPQASCQPRFPRYHDDVRINPKPGKHGRYSQARKMGKAEARSAVAAAGTLGIVPGSTLFYDLEGYDNGNTHCRESALAFLHGWTRELHRLDYVSGVYSSASSGIKALDEARLQRPGTFTLPDTIWIADWNGRANTSTSYIREDGWRPGGRLKQYRGGHDEVWGGARINIDSNFLDLGKGSVAPRVRHCDGVNVNFRKYDGLRPPRDGKASNRKKVRALQCLLQEKGLYAGKLNGRYNKRTTAAARTWQQQHGFTPADRWTKKHWMTLLADGPRWVAKHGSAGEDVRRLQRALNAANPKAPVKVDGTFSGSTTAAVRAWQKRAGVRVTGIVAPNSWKALQAGRR